MQELQKVQVVQSLLNIGVRAICSTLVIYVTVPDMRESRGENHKIMRLCGRDASNLQAAF